MADEREQESNALTAQGDEREGSTPLPLNGNGEQDEQPTPTFYFDAAKPQEVGEDHQPLASFAAEEQHSSPDSGDDLLPASVTAGMETPATGEPPADTAPPATNSPFGGATAPLGEAGSIAQGTAPLGDANAGTAPLLMQPEPVPAGMEWDEVPTAILADRQRTLSLLPTGALLNEHYAVRLAISQSPERNLYRAEQFPPTDAPSYYTISEYASPGLLEGEVKPTALDHPYVAPVNETFTYTPYGKARYYAVYPASAESIHLSELPLPQASERVMTWAGQLADALAYLHERDVYAPDFATNNILIEGERALLGSISGAQVGKQTGQLQGALARDDVRQLASMITYALTGAPDATADSLARLTTAEGRPLPATVREVLAPALRGELATAASFAERLKLAWQTVAAPPTDLVLHSGKMTHVGMVRRNNQDSLAALECALMTQSLSGACGIYVVADGMGGHSAGEVASALAVNTIIAHLLHDTVVPLYSEAASEETVSAEAASQRVAHAVEEANDQIHAMRLSERSDMGTTAVVALVMDGRAYIGNVGDSRLYLYRQGEGLRQVTKDHSLVARLIELGQISPEEADYHPHRHVIFRSMGEKQGVNVDTFVERMQAGDRLLLCSDGINNMVTDAQIAEALITEADPQLASEKLVAMANAAGGVDNSSIIIVNIEQVEMSNQ